jgi:hypothetical protein
MIQQVVYVTAAMAVALVVAYVLKRRHNDAPTQGGYQIPTHVDRRDFDHPNTPWLVAVFTSATCHTCVDVSTKAQVLTSVEVAVQRIDYTVNSVLHKRYRIDAVPLLVIADATGVVHRSFIGPVKAQDLWAAMAECRDPGSTPESCSSHH